MEPEFWLERWKSSQTAFHLSEPHRYLTEFGGRLLAPEHPSVLVPLCGKSQDLVWLLRSGAAVTGIELSELAVEQFFSENGLEFERSSRDAIAVYEARGLPLRLFAGDFFAIAPEDVGRITGVYDRAALVALPEAMRGEYARHWLRLAPDAQESLLITMVYNQEEMAGPPFSLHEDEVRVRFGGELRVEKLRSVAVLEEEPRFRERGLSALAEELYSLRR
jgi:thiopurine S-methyltransferase